MALPSRAAAYASPANASFTNTSRRHFGSAAIADDYPDFDLACRRYTHASHPSGTHHHRAAAPDAWRTAGNPQWDPSGAQSPTPSTASTSTTRGGWSEGSSNSPIVPSPDTGRQYLQILTQSKPPLLHHRTYQLVVVQQPQTTAEFGQHDMSRLPLAPPLFVRLVIRNSVGAEVTADAELPFFVARVTLHAAGSPHAQDLTLSANLYGTTISGPHTLRGMDGAPGAYFIFPDVGVRRRGRWRLHVSLLRIARVGAETLFGEGDESACLTGVWTDPFEVVSAEGYIAPQRTALTRHFQSQGVRMYISNSVVPR